MQTFKLKKRLLKLLTPFDRTPGPALYVKAHHGPFGQWSNPEHVATLIAMGLKAEDHVLDYGCGYGRMAEMLFKWGVRRYYGIDCDSDAIRYARRHHGYPDYHYFWTQSESELYGSSVAAANPTRKTGWTAAIAQSLITHLLPGETTGLFDNLSSCSTLNRAYVSVFLAENCAEARKCGAKIPLASGVWVMRKDNPSAVVAYHPVFLKQLAPCWEVEYRRGFWRDKTVEQCRRMELPYQDYMILTR